MESAIRDGVRDEGGRQALSCARHRLALIPLSIKGDILFRLRIHSPYCPFSNLTYTPYLSIFLAKPLSFDDTSHTPLSGQSHGKRKHVCLQFIVKSYRQRLVMLQKRKRGRAVNH